MITATLMYLIAYNRHRVKKFPDETNADHYDNNLKDQPNEAHRAAYIENICYSNGLTPFWQHGFPSFPKDESLPAMRSVQKLWDKQVRANCIRRFGMVPALTPLPRW